MLPFAPFDIVQLHRIQCGSSKICYANDPATNLFSLNERKQCCRRIICMPDFRAARLNAMHPAIPGSTLVP